jgi:hypothetical protein
MMYRSKAGSYNVTVLPMQGAPHIKPRPGNTDKRCQVWLATMMVLGRGRLCSTSYVGGD